MSSPLKWIRLFTSNLPNSSFVRSSAPWFSQAPWPTTWVGTLWTTPSSRQSCFLCCLASTSTFSFFSLPWPRIFTAINVAKSSSLSKDSGSPIYKSSITPTRKTSLCLLEGLKVGIPTLPHNLNGRLSLPCSSWQPFPWCPQALQQGSVLDQGSPSLLKLTLPTCYLYNFLLKLLP